MRLFWITTTGHADFPIDEMYEIIWGSFAEPLELK